MRSASLPSMPWASPSPVCPPNLLFLWVSQERCVFVMEIIAPDFDCFLPTSDWSRHGGFLEGCVSWRWLGAMFCLRNQKMTLVELNTFLMQVLEFITRIPMTAVVGSSFPSLLNPWTHDHSPFVLKI